MQLAEDFQTFVTNLANDGSVNQSNISEYSSLFSNSWTDIAPKILSKNTKLKVPEVTDFYAKHEQLISAGRVNDI